MHLCEHIALELHVRTVPFIDLLVPHPGARESSNRAANATDSTCTNLVPHPHELVNRTIVPPRGQLRIGRFTCPYRVRTVCSAGLQLYMMHQSIRRTHD